MPQEPKSNPTSSHQDHEDLVREIQSVREDMEKLASRMVELSQTLYQRVRKSPVDDYTSRYVAYANAWTRFGSMVDGGIRRTAGVNRLVAAIHRDRVEAEDAAQRQAQKERARLAREGRRSVTTDTDLISLYGEEMVNHAAR